MCDSKKCKTNKQTKSDRCFPKKGKRNDRVKGRKKKRNEDDGEEQKREICDRPKGRNEAKSKP